MAWGCQRPQGLPTIVGTVSASDVTLRAVFSFVARRYEALKVRGPALWMSSQSGLTQHCAPLKSPWPSRWILRNRTLCRKSSSTHANALPRQNASPGYLLVSD